VTDLMHLSEEPFRSDAIAAGQEFAHFGIRGMRWGVRKKETSSGANTTPDPYYQEDYSSGREGSGRGRKIAAGLAITAVVGAGAVFAVSYMAKSGKSPVSAINTVKKAAETSSGKPVSAASRLFEGQEYAAYTMTHLGGVRIP
jgi:hypothetical protein